MSANNDASANAGDGVNVQGADDDFNDSSIVSAGSASVIALPVASKQADQTPPAATAADTDSAPASQAPSTTPDSSPPPASAPAPLTPIAPLWKSQLLRSGKGTKGPIRKLLANALLPLRRASEWRGILQYDACALAVLLLKAPPWVGEQEAAAWKARPWTDQDDRLWTEWLQKNNIDVGISVAAEAIQAAAREHPIHPIRNYLTALKWDRQPRIHEWLHTIMGADNTPYHSAIGAKYLISGVARIMTPGCKADSLLQLEGRQGIGKGTALEILAVKSQWFSDEIRDVGGREAAMGLAGRWIVEFSELAALSGKSWESQKAFISRTVDRYRPPWGRGVGDFPRQCIFASTTNRFETLGDTTGNRRFWPVRCHFVDREILRANRDQLWAEAKARFDSGEKWWLDSPDLVALAEEAQEERFEEDVNEDAIARFLEKREHVSIAEIMDLVLEIDPAQSSRGDQKRIADVLRHLGWERVQLRAEDGTKKRVFRRCK